MYCVKCGRRAREGERRCPACGMRLVTPARLNRLLDEAKQSAGTSKKQSVSAQNALAELARLSDRIAGRVRTASASAADGLRKLNQNLEPQKKKLRRTVRRLRRRFTRFINRYMPRKTEDSGKVKVARSKKAARRRESFAERNLRTVVSMSLIGLALLILLMWGTISEPGKRAFASFGMGSSQGYILLGDEFMSGGNYLRAVESYYTSLDHKESFEAAFKLARAYSYTGDMEKCVSALLFCTDNYPTRREAYIQLIAIYPDKNNRPDRIKAAIEKGNAQFGLE